jgi:hypothetical protein
MKIFKKIESVVNWVNSVVELIKNWKDIKDIIGAFITIMVVFDYCFEWIGKNFIFLLALLSSITLTFLGLIERYQRNKAPFPKVCLLPNQNQLRLYNKGDFEIGLHGTKFLNGSPSIDPKVRYIPVKMYYYFLTDSISKYSSQEIGTDGEAHAPFEVYLSDLKKNQYIARFNLLIKMNKGAMSIHTQQFGVTKEKWPIS